LKITIENNEITALFNRKGAELCSLKSNGSHREYMWNGNPNFWGKHAPILFPIVGTLKDNQYRYKGQSYALSRHGFARDLEFEVVGKTANSVVFSLESTEETKSNYPFDFELQIGYNLVESSLNIEYKIINKMDERMPFSIGGHPAFALPKNFTSYALEFEQQETLESFTLENDLLSNTKVNIALNERVLPLSYSLFEKDALIFKSLNSKKISILEESKPLLHFYFEDFTNFGIWTKTNAPFICLEPWLGYSDLTSSDGNIENKEAIQFVEANATFECSYSIEIIL
jgi:galactose mutarotase-like enzyme